MTGRKTFVKCDFMRLCFFIYLGLLLLVLFSSTATLINDISTSDEYAYERCVSGCKEKYFVGYKKGSDLWKTNPVITEFDRTPCIGACNNMYLNLKNVKN